jgi:hypothetical protein
MQMIKHIEDEKIGDFDLFGGARTTFYFQIISE